MSDRPLHTLPVPKQPVPIVPSMPEDDGVKWLALAIRQGFLLIVAAIERKYGLTRSDHA